MRSLNAKDAGSCWLEVLLTLCILTLVLQLLPINWLYLWNRFAWEINLGNWPAGRWFIINAVVVILFCGIRYWSEVVTAWQEHKEMAQSRRQQVASKKEAHAKQLRRIEQRKMLEQMKEARRRRMY